MLNQDELYRLMKPVFDDAVRGAINQVLDLAAKGIESLDLYDGYDESTRDAAAELVQNLKIRVEEG